MRLTPGKQRGLDRLADPSGRFRMIAVDQRPPIKNLIATRLNAETPPWEEVAQFKALLVSELERHASAMLLDPHYAIPAALDLVSPRRGLVVTLEDSVFVDSPAGRLSKPINHWSVDKIKRMGADAVKALIWYRPDAGEDVRLAQQDLAKRIGDSCARFDIPFLLELLVYPMAGNGASITSNKAELVLASVAEFSKPHYGVDVFKLESPVPPVDVDGSTSVQAVFDEMGQLAGRPWVVLSAGATTDEFRRVLSHAYDAGASGFLAGRSIWMNALEKYPDWQQISAELRNQSVPYLLELNELTTDRARPFADDHGQQDLTVDFRREYAGTVR